MRQFDRAASSVLKSAWEMNKQKEKVSEKLCGSGFSHLKFWMVWRWQPRLYSLKRNKFPNWKIESFHFNASSYITLTVKNHRQPDNHKNSRFCSRQKKTQLFSALKLLNSELYKMKEDIIQHSWFKLYRLIQNNFQICKFFTGIISGTGPIRIHIRSLSWIRLSITAKYLHKIWLNQKKSKNLIQVVKTKK